jgi:L-ascorbate metabolism protein UlaG (beta-lactamase superfamily)
MRITLIGGPTALIELDEFRLLTDPTFDPPGAELTSGLVTLRKTIGPAREPSELGPIDAVLLSHDQHFDNLDRSGREFLTKARVVLTTPTGANRLDANAVGLGPWQSTHIQSPYVSSSLTVTGTPARHGPPGIEPLLGEVTGFVLQLDTAPKSSVYVTGDTVWYEGVAEVAKKYSVAAIVLFAGAAKVAARGPEHLTMNTEDAVATALAFPNARIFPVHHQGWEHFSESQQSLVAAFDEAGLSDRLQPLVPGVPVSFDS